MLRVNLDSKFGCGILLNENIFFYTIVKRARTLSHISGRFYPLQIVVYNIRLSWRLSVRLLLVEYAIQYTLLKFLIIMCIFQMQILLNHIQK